MNWSKYSIDPNDFLVINWKELQVPEYTYLQRKISYNQNDVWSSSCSIHWVMTTITNNFYVDFTLQDRQAIWNMAILQWANPEMGWDMLSAVKLVVTYVKEHKNLNLAYYRVNFLQYEELIKKWFSIVTWFTNKEWFTKDRMDNCVVWESVSEYWDRKWWHLISLYWNNWLWYIDNYLNHTKCNNTKIVNILQLVQAWTFWDNGYVFSIIDPVKKWYNWMTYTEKIAKLKARPESLSIK